MKTTNYTGLIILMHQHDLARRLKRRALNECKSLKGLIVKPRTEWEAHKYVRLEVSLRTEIYDQVDELISTERLFTDLNS